MGKYDDIIHHPHHVSEHHPQMSMLNRAAQFAPFAALTGYDAAIGETARLTDQQVELEEYDQERLNRKMTSLMEHIGEEPTITIVYFKPDDKKSGGSYQTITGVLKMIIETEHCLLMKDGNKIPLSSIVDIFLPFTP